jgi:hypothetical protein
MIVRGVHCMLCWWAPTLCRRMKTEFMVQIEGASSDSDRRVFFMGATNRPWVRTVCCGQRV